MVVYTLSLHDALPICETRHVAVLSETASILNMRVMYLVGRLVMGLNVPENLALAMVLLLGRSEELTSELQSSGHLVCRLLLVKNIVVTYTDIKSMSPA